MTPTRSDLNQAKQVLSTRYLSGLRSYGAGEDLMIMNAAAPVTPNIHAVGIGRKVVNGASSKQSSVRVYVEKKLAKSKLLLRQQIPPAVDGIPVDVIVSQPAFIPFVKSPRAKKLNAAAALDVWRTRQRPIYSGISVAHQNVTAGTLACLCRSIRPDEREKIYVLSNNHVFADVNRASPASKLFQPGPADRGTADDHFADLHRFVPIDLGPSGNNRVDAAIGVLHEEMTYLVDDSTMLLNQIGPLSGVGEAIEGMTVRKHGRTTGYTEGVVTDESLDVKVGMDHSDPNVIAVFKNQMRIDRVNPYPAFGRGGDSGSLVVTKDGQLAVGLYFAGAPSGSYGIANHMADVLNELEIEILVNAN